MTDKLPWAHLAPHRVDDAAKLATMIDCLERGGELPPVLWDGNAAFEGSHRLAAWEATGQRPRLILVNNDDLAAAADLLSGSDAELIDWFDEGNLAALHRAIARAGKK